MVIYRLTFNGDFVHENIDRFLNYLKLDFDVYRSS